MHVWRVENIVFHQYVGKGNRSIGNLLASQDKAAIAAALEQHQTCLIFVDARRLRGISWPFINTMVQNVPLFDRKRIDSIVTTPDGGLLGAASILAQQFFFSLDTFDSVNDAIARAGELGYTVEVSMLNPPVPIDASVGRDLQDVQSQ